MPEVEDTPAKMIAEYIALRDFKKATDEQYDAFIKERYGDRMDKLETQLLDLLNKMGSDSIKTPAGTAFKKAATSVTVADQREFKRHIIGGELWDLIEWRPAKTAIEQLVEVGEELPPGLNRSVFTKVNIRRNS
jgi:hypothetical protein